MSFVSASVLSILLLLTVTVTGEWNAFLCRPVLDGCDGDPVHSIISECELLNTTKVPACCPANIIQRWEDNAFKCRHGAPAGYVKNTDEITEDSLQSLDLGVGDKSASADLSHFLTLAITVAAASFGLA